MRRKIVFNKNLARGRKIKRNDLLIVRAIDKGVFASDIYKILGKKLLINKNKRFKNITVKNFTFFNRHFFINQISKKFLLF